MQERQAREEQLARQQQQAFEEHLAYEDLPTEEELKAEWEHADIKQREAELEKMKYEQAIKNRRTNRHTQQPEENWIGLKQGESLYPNAANLDSEIREGGKKIDHFTKNPGLSESAWALGQMLWPDKDNQYIQDQYNKMGTEFGQSVKLLGKYIKSRGGTIGSEESRKKLLEEIEGLSSFNKAGIPALGDSLIKIGEILTLSPGVAGIVQGGLIDKAVEEINPIFESQDQGAGTKSDATEKNINNEKETGPQSNLLRRSENQLPDLERAYAIARETGMNANDAINAVDRIRNDEKSFNDLLYAMTA